MTQAKLKSLFEYNKDTGIFTRIKQTSSTARVGDELSSLTDRGYIQVWIDGKNRKVHRLAWLYIHGKFPDGDLDHINHIRNDNRICNLREVSMLENCKNLSNRKHNTSGRMGVSKSPTKGKFIATIKANKTKYHLGTFETFEDAVVAREIAEVAYGFHQNHGA